MKIENDKWVEIHYTLKDDNGNQIDSSVGNEPLGQILSVFHSDLPRSEEILG